MCQRVVEEAMNYQPACSDPTEEGLRMEEAEELMERRKI